MTEIELPKGFSRLEVCLMLNRLRNKFGKRPIGKSTFYRWCGELGITPKFRYSTEEVNRLQKLCLHYSQGGKSTNIPAI
jgi:hypothetical protein